MSSYSPPVLPRPEPSGFAWDGQANGAWSDASRLGDPGTGERNDGVTRRDVARVLFKHKTLIFLTFLVVTVVVAAGLMLLPATYATRAKILIRADQQADPAFFSGLAAVNEARAYEASGRRLETEMALLEVIPVSAEAVQDEKLTYDQVYHSPRGFFQTPVLEAVDEIRHALFGTRPKDRRGFGAIVRDFQGGLSVQPAPVKGPDALSDIVVVTLRAPDPLVAQRSLTALLDSYLRLDAKINEDAGRAALRIVDAEAQEATAHLADAEQRLRDFLARHEGQRPPTSASAAPGADGAALAHLKARLVELELDLLNARRVYRPESEQVRSLERQVGDLRARVRLDVAGDASDYSRETQLRRDVREAESRYDQLLSRVEGISLFLQVSTQQVGQRVIIEPPGLPSSSDWQKRLIIGLAGAVFGLMLGLLFAGVREMSDQTLGTKHDVTKALGMETLAVLPEMKAAELRAAMRATPDGHVASARGRDLVNEFRDLAASIRNMFPGGWAHESDGRVVLVTSARAREGTTTVAAGLAAQLAAAAAGQVLLVGDRSGMGGMRDGLAGVDIARPWYLPDASGDPERAGPDSASPREASVAADASRAADFVRETRRRYRWVIVDAGSSAEGVASILAPLVDGALVVVEAEHTRKQVVRDSLRRLGGFTGKFVAVVLNRQRRFIPRLLYEYL